MAATPPAREIPGAWIGAEDLPIHYANAFVTVVGPQAIFVNIGSAQPPSISGETEEERARQVAAVTYVPVRPVARIAVTAELLDEFIAALEGARENHQNLLRVLKERGEEGPP